MGSGVRVSPPGPASDILCTVRKPPSVKTLIRTLGNPKKVPSGVVPHAKGHAMSNHTREIVSEMTQARQTTSLYGNIGVSYTVILPLHARVAQLTRASDSYPEGRWFDPSLWHQNLTFSEKSDILYM